MRPKIAAAFIGLALATCCIPRVGAAAPELLRDRTASQRPALLVVGTAHFGNPGRDLLNPAVDDVLSPSRQAQIASVVQQLVAFRPTRVVLEWPATQQNQLDRTYADYVAGKAQLGRTEKEQLGLRLAKLAGLDHVEARKTSTSGTRMAMRTGNVMSSVRFSTRRSCLHSTYPSTRERI